MTSSTTWWKSSISIAWWPGRVTAGTTSDHIGAFWDLLPTFAELAGADAPEHVDGLSFVSALTGEGEQRSHESLFWAFYERGGARAMRAGKWKAIQQAIDTPSRLYDLERDLREERDLAAEHPELVERLRAEMEAAVEPSELWKFERAPFGEGG